MPLDKDLVKAKNGYPAQNYNPNTSAYEEVYSTNNAPWMQLIGNMLEEQLTEVSAVNGVVTFSDDIVTIEIFNRDTTNDGTFTVNGIDILVPKGSVYKSGVSGTKGKTVSIANSTTYIISRYS